MMIAELRQGIFAGAVFIALVGGAHAGEELSPAAYYRVVATQVERDNPVAVLEPEQGERNTVSVGDPIGECLVTAIEDDAVELSCPGAKLNLPLNTARIRSTSQPGHWSPDPASYQYSVSGKALKKLLSDKEQLASNFCVVPHVKDGHVHGYRVDVLVGISALSELGLAVDDVIVSVNGAPADNPGSFIRTVNTLADTPQFRFEVERDGEVHALTYNFSQ